MSRRPTWLQPRHRGRTARRKGLPGVFQSAQRTLVFNRISKVCLYIYRTGHHERPMFADFLPQWLSQPGNPLTQLCNPTANPCETPLRDPPLRDLKRIFARPQKFFEPRPVNCNIPYPLHREIVTQSILLLGKHKISDPTFRDT